MLIGSLRYLLIFILNVFAAGALAEPLVAGDEVAGVAFVSWKAVIEKVSRTGMHGYGTRARLNFHGRTIEGKQIRGAGKLRFVSEPKEVFAIGDRLRGNDSLKYWATLKTMMGEDLAIIEGTGLLDFSKTGTAVTTEGAIDFKAALEIYHED